MTAFAIGLDSNSSAVIPSIIVSMLFSTSLLSTAIPCRYVYRDACIGTEALSETGCAEKGNVECLID